MYNTRLGIVMAFVSVLICESLDIMVHNLISMGKQIKMVSFVENELFRVK